MNKYQLTIDIDKLDEDGDISNTVYRMMLQGPGPLVLLETARSQMEVTIESINRFIGEDLAK